MEDLAGEFKEVKNSWGMPGVINRLLFPVFFPTRCEIMVEARFGISRVRNDNVVEKMIALKEHGNSLLKDNKFEEAIFSHTLAALKIEREGIDDRNKTIVELTAQCHSNIALAKLKIATNRALACSNSIYLIPRWGNHTTVAASATRIRALLNSQSKTSKKRLNSVQRTMYFVTP